MIKTQGIIIKTIKYKDNSLITKILTKDIGYKSFIIDRKKFSNSLQNFTCLNIVEIVAQNNEQKAINSLIAISNAVEYTIKFYLKNNVLFILISDILNKTLHENIIYENLFAFVLNFTLKIRKYNSNPTVILIQFLVEYSKYLGFGIHDLKEFDNQLKSIDICNSMTDSEKILLRDIINNRLDATKSSDGILVSIMDKLVVFYKFHCPGIQYLKSLDVFKNMEL